MPYRTVPYHTVPYHTIHSYRWYFTFAMDPFKGSIRLCDCSLSVPKPGVDRYGFHSYTSSITFRADLHGVWQSVQWLLCCRFLQIISHQFSSNFSSYLRVKIPGCAIRIIEALPPEQQRYAIDKASLAGLQFYRYYIEVSIEVAKRALFEIQKSSHLQPLAATRVAASGRKWPQVAASGRKWPQVAASGRKWPQVAARASGYW